MLGTSPVLTLPVYGNEGQEEYAAQALTCIVNSSDERRQIMARKISSQRRREIDRKAGDIRLECLRLGLTKEETVDRILRALPEVFPLEAWRFANGWARSEVAARLDMLYESDGLAAPGVDAAVLCRWEHGDRRPGEERIDYFCRLYRTRPDRLGFGNDHSPGDMSHLQRVGIIDAYPYTSKESEEDLLNRIREARQRVNMFGLTRNFYGRENVLPIFEEKAAAVPINIYVMDPYCESRKDRYRIEPSEAAMEDPDRYMREVLRPLHEVSKRRPGLRVWLFNFPVSFGIEETDDVARVMLYGHGKRGTEGPIITFVEGTPTHAYFIEQLRWLERLTEDSSLEPWASKGVTVRPLEL
jgi:transcriptional regulator with XRE-family HTH domain